MTQIDKYIEEIKKACALHKVKILYAFGSVLTDRFGKDSDIDLVVDFEQIAVALYADNYYNLKFLLEDIFNKPVDLLEEKAIKNPYFKESLNRQRQLIYEDLQGLIIPIRKLKDMSKAICAHNDSEETL